MPLSDRCTENSRANSTSNDCEIDCEITVYREIDSRSLPKTEAEQR
jgi:hypothetical protein